MDWKKISQLLSLTAAGIGAIALAGWIFGIDPFKRVHPKLVTMKANTAICLMLAGFAVACLRHEGTAGWKLLIARMGAVIVGITGLLTLAQHLGHWEFGIDQFLFRESLEEAGQSFPGRMGPASALNFILLSAGILLLDHRPRKGSWPAQFCAIFVIGITLLIFLAYFYGVESFQPVALYASIAIHTVVAFWLLAVALLLVRPGRGITMLLLSDNTGGIVARRLLPAALIVPALLGWLRIVGERAGWFDTGMGTSLFAMGLVIVFILLIWWTAQALGREDSTRGVAEVVRNQHAAIVDSSDDAIVSKNLDGIVTSWNAGAERLFGYSAAEMTGQPILRLIPPDRREEETMILGRLRAGERIEHYETIRRTKDGRDVFVSLTVSPVRDASGTITGASKIARDITPRKVFDAKLLASETLKSAILNTSLDGFIVMNHEGRIDDWNPAATRIFGFTRDEAIGRLLTDIIVPERLREAHRNGLARYVATRESRILGRRYEMPGLRADGTEFPCEISISLIPGTEPPLFAGYLRDITERKQAEAALEMARQQADAASRAKDEFLAALSHELRTPLTPVLMLSASMEHADELPQSVRDDFAMIRKNVELEARIIDDLLDLTRITQGKLALHFEQVDPQRLITDTIEILLSEIDGKKINVAVNFAAARHHVRADAVRLQQVLWNIIKNAVKFTPEGGSITVSTENAGDHWKVSVADTGLGITAEELPRIFDAWAQGDAGAAPRFGGLGLGLSISMHIVRHHDGRLWAESAGRGQGAVFHLEFPLSSPALPAPDQPAEAPPPPLPALRILLVEDHQASRETLARLLVRRGHTVETAGSIAQALAVAAAGSFDLVISDLGLPDGRGHELMRALRRDFGLRGIALSGYGMQSDIAQSNEAGFDEHLTKPVSLPLLEAALRRIMEGANAGDG